jgi:hypothetical protein
LSRFFILRADGYRILFHSATAGIGLLVLSNAIVVALGKSPEPFIQYIKQFDVVWHNIAPFNYSGIAALSLLLGSSLWFPLNLAILNRNFQIDNVIQRKADPLETLLRRAMGKGELIFLLLKNRQVYIGYVVSNYNPIFHVNFLKILPLVRGHQNKKAIFEFTTSYCDSFSQAQVSVTSAIEEARRLREQNTESNRWKNTKLKFWEKNSQQLDFEDIQDKVSVEHLCTTILIDDVISAKILSADDYSIYLKRDD